MMFLEEIHFTNCSHNIGYILENCDHRNINVFQAAKGHILDEYEKRLYKETGNAVWLVLIDVYLPEHACDEHPNKDSIHRYPNLN